MEEIFSYNRLLVIAFRLFHLIVCRSALWNAI